MISLLIAFAGASVAEQMEPARHGQLQCGQPDELFKTCSSLSKVSQVGTGSVRFETKLLIDPNGPVVAVDHNTATIHGSQVCEVFRFSQIDRWTVTIGGRADNSARTEKYRAAAKRGIAPLVGQTVCTTIVPSEQGMHKVLATIGGKRAPAFDYAMKWVDPDDGWVVGQ